ncbi:hypothetical protein ACFOD4_15240 [Pseudoroseomonas globiformis]|uniref:Uncharacterized protein n=1 Tax=Teichococcus globiformis TaxID=2307229 RepID=A0ABV7G3L4_9PROT
MRDLSIEASFVQPRVMGGDRQPSFAKGLLWGCALCVPIWGAIGWAVSRAL